MALEGAREDHRRQRLVHLERRGRDADAHVALVGRLRAAERDRAEPAAQVKADGDAGLGRRRPERLPRLVPQRRLDARRQEHAGAQAEALQVADFLRRAPGVVDRDEAGADEARRGGRAELGEPVVVGAIADAAQPGVLDEQRHDRPVHHSRVHAVTVHVVEAQRGRRRPQHAGLQDAAALEREAPAAHGAGRARAAAPGIPAVAAADPVRALGRVHDLRGALAPRRGHARLPEILRQPLEVDVVVGGDDAVLHGALLAAASRMPESLSRLAALRNGPATAYVSMGKPTMLPHSVQEPS